MKITGSILKNTATEKVGEKAFHSCRHLDTRAFGTYRPRFFFLFVGLAAILVLSVSLRPWTGAPRLGSGPCVRLPADLDVLDASAFSQGEETIFPLRPLAGNGVNMDFSARKAHTVVRRELTPTSSVIAGAPDSDALEPAHASIAVFRRGLLLFSRGKVSVKTIEGAVPIFPLRHSSAPFLSEPADLFHVDMFAPASARGTAPLLYGERLDENGSPSRWSATRTDSPDPDVLICDLAFDPDRISLEQLVRGVDVPAAGAGFRGRASRYRDFVSRYAERYNLAAPLVLAIMHVESRFDPFAVSPRRAVGLMQVVPDTAGSEVNRYLTGSAEEPSLETLFSPEDNIRYGSVYLHLLTRRYFAEVMNTASRQMCIIAAYNGGPGTVLRHFDEDPDLAVERINALSPEQLYTILTTAIPNAETRRYVERVMALMRGYTVGLNASRPFDLAEGR